MGRYSYSHPSDSSHYGGDQADSGYSETEELIGRDQAELELKYPEPSRYPTQYPPQPEVEFGFPQAHKPKKPETLATQTKAPLTRSTASIHDGTPQQSNPGAISNDRSTGTTQAQKLHNIITANALKTEFLISECINRRRRANPSLLNTTTDERLNANHHPVTTGERQSSSDESSSGQTNPTSLEN
ncbi:hypothetical protein Bca4012_051168 [Brassica carinata]|uniref:Uncharacterized protein n=1 Tax=Brassica carinata TaxID=52824 RepID=A0A8X7R4M5_BRACI|nr:hypothetical protein Bca52824_053813 [Brassica carinata]